METVKNTSFATIYDRFLARVTSDMYMEITEGETYHQMQDILLNAIHWFKLPRFDVYNYELGYWDDLGWYCGVESDNIEVPATGWVGGTFNIELTPEEQNILALYMVVEWIGQQITTTENSKMKFSGSDFKFTSQANHMAKLKNIKEQYLEEGSKLQDIYKRRKRVDGKFLSTLGQIMETPGYGYKI